MGRRLTFLVLALAVWTTSASAVEDWWLHGSYESNDSHLNISRRLLVTDHNLSLTLTNGHKIPLQFNERLRAVDDGEVYFTRANVTVPFMTNIGYLYCTYAVELDFISFDEGEGLEIEFAFPANIGIDAYGRCFAQGIKTQVRQFEKTAWPLQE